jgi:hypothetical protein
VRGDSCGTLFPRIHGLTLPSYSTASGDGEVHYQNLPDASACGREPGQECGDVRAKRTQGSSSPAQRPTRMTP